MRRAAEIELALGPKTPGDSLQQWLYAELRGAILSGRLAADTRLPATRELARQQGVSRGTVLAAYEQLTAEGYLVGMTGRGTRVSAALPTPGRPSAPAAPLAELPRPLSRQGALLAASPFPRSEPSATLRCFRPNQPDLSTFPSAIWNRIVARRANALRPERMGYGDAAGYLPLREAIAAHVQYSQRIVCHAGQVMILGSAQQGLDLAARLLLDAGDTVLLEDPGYPGAKRIFELTGARVQGVPVDALGMDVAAGIAAAPAARLAYVTAAHQSPMGMALSLERRLALLAWAAARGAVIIEDDYDGEYRYAGTPLAALKSLDTQGSVIYLGSFSKLLFPALRLAYMVVPEWLAGPFSGALSLSCRHTPLQSQHVLSEFIAEGHFARHLRAMRQNYGERGGVLAEACRQQLAGALTLLPISTGLDATALLQGLDDDVVSAALATAGIDSRSLSFYGIARKPPSGLVLGFSAFTPAAIRDGVTAMARVIETLPRKGCV